MIMKSFILINSISAGVLYLISLTTELMFLGKIFIARIRKEDEIGDLIVFLFFSSNSSNILSYFTIKCLLELGFSKDSAIIGTLFWINNLSNFIEILALFVILFKLYKENGPKLKFHLYTYFCVWFGMLYFASIVNPEGYFDILFNPVNLIKKGSVQPSAAVP